MKKNKKKWFEVKTKRKSMKDLFIGDDRHDYVLHITFYKPFFKHMSYYNQDMGQDTYNDMILTEVRINGGEPQSIKITDAVVPNRLARYYSFCPSPFFSYQFFNEITKLCDLDKIEKVEIDFPTRDTHDVNQIIKHFKKFGGYIRYRYKDEIKDKKYVLIEEDLA